MASNAHVRDEYEKTMNLGTAPLYIFIACSKLLWHWGFMSFVILESQLVFP